MNEKKRVCPDCGAGISRRAFLRTTAAAAALAPAALRAAPARGTPEDLVKELYQTLRDDQRKEVCFPWDHPLRMKVANNWEIVKPQIGKFYTGNQQALIRDIFKGLTSGDGHGRFLKAFEDDGGGFENYHIALFGDVDGGKLAWVMTGRHLTLRCDGDGQAGAGWGGPIFYGHAPEDAEKPEHPGNVWWAQARLANKVFQSLDGRQREKALLPRSPADDEKSIRIRAEQVGLCAGGLSADQKGLVEACLKDLLSPYRDSDAAEALALVKEAGGIDRLHLSFYADRDIGKDGVWDNWMVQGPSIAWYFRGAPHVHTWVNLAKA